MMQVVLTTSLKELKDAIGWVAAFVGAAIGKVLGAAAIIPTVFAFAAYFLSNWMDKKIRGSGRTWGGWGQDQDLGSAFTMAMSIEAGHILWVLLGLGLALAGVRAAIQVEPVVYLEALVFVALSATFCVWPRWWSAIALCAFNVGMIYGISQAMDQIAGFPTKTRELIEAGYISHSLFHALGGIAVSWFAALQAWRNIKSGRQWWQLMARPARETSAEARLEQLASLRGRDLISNDDYEAKKAEILRQL